MSWRDRRDLRGGASFRGVSFYVDDVSTEQGRRTVIHRFPGSDRVKVDDLGREAQGFSVTAYTIGPDYDLARDQLEEALLKGGPGELVHPWRGSYTVEITGPVRTRESKRDGGMASISFEVTVVQPDDVRLPVRRDTRAQVSLDADALFDASVDSFADSFSVDGLPSDLQDSAISALGAATDQIRSVNTAARSQLGAVGQLSSDIAEFTAEVNTLIQTPQGLAVSLGGLVANVYASMVTPSENARRVATMLVDAARGLMNFGDDFPAVVESTTLRAQEAANLAAISALHRASSASEVSRAIANVSFQSFTSARAARDTVTSLLDRVAEDVDDATFEAVSALRASIVEHLDRVASTLPEIAEYTPKAEVPAVLLAHLLYGDARREAEIIDRNDPEHPGFLPAGQPLEVLSA